jgi:hypothetical protein
MQTTILKLCGAGLIVASLAASSQAIADTSTVTPELQRAFAKAEQGPDQLRWYVLRTRGIYSLNFDEVMTQYQARKTATADAPTKVAQAKQD